MIAGSVRLTSCGRRAAGVGDLDTEERRDGMRRPRSADRWRNRRPWRAAASRRRRSAAASTSTMILPTIFLMMMASTKAEHGDRDQHPRRTGLDGRKVEVHPLKSTVSRAVQSVRWTWVPFRVPRYQARDRSACCLIQACMAMPAATPALMDRVDPNWAIDTVVAAAAFAAAVRPSDSEPNSSSESRGIAAVSTGTEPGDVVHRNDGQSAAGRVPRRVLRHRRDGADADSGPSPSPRGGSSAAGRRCARRRPPKALAVRTTVPMLWSWPKFSMATSNG